MKRLIIIIVFSIVLVGCGAINMPNDFILQRDSSNGVVVVSLTYSGVCVRGVDFKFHKGSIYDPFRGNVYLSKEKQDLLDWGKWCEGQSSWSGKWPEGVTQSEVGRVFAFLLPAGEYKFYKTLLEEVWSKRISMPFTVLPGRITYLGNIHIQAQENETSFADKAKLLIARFSVSGKSRYTSKFGIRDMRERDLELLKKKHPNLEIDDVEVRSLIMMGPIKEALRKTLEKKKQ